MMKGFTLFLFSLLWNSNSGPWEQLTPEPSLNLNETACARKNLFIFAQVLFEAFKNIASGRVP